MNYQEKTKEEMIKAERRKLAQIYKKLDKKMQKVVDSLVDEAAFVAVSLYELRQIIDEKGYTEEYQNGANQKGVKKCSEVEIYNTMLKSYSAIIKQLTELVPREVKIETEKDDGFEFFVRSRDG